MILCALIVKVMTLAYAGYASLVARFWPGVAALAITIYLTLARLLGTLPDGPRIPLSAALEETWWLYPCAVLLLSLAPMGFAFYKTRALREDDPKHASMDRAALAFLANVLFDAALLLIVGVGLVLVAGDA